MVLAHGKPPRPAYTTLPSVSRATDSPDILGDRVARVTRDG
jgi:hypothetical protein